MNLEVLSDSGAIVPVVVGNIERSMALSAALLSHGVFVPAIRPPTVAPGSCRLRFTVTAAHSDDDINQAIKAMQVALGEMG